MFLREFVHCDDNPTIWGNSYETSLTKSEGSSESSGITSKLSLNESCHNLQTTVDLDIPNSNDNVNSEAEKENVPHFVINSAIVNEFPSKLAERPSSLSGSSNNSDNSSTIGNFSLYMNPDERKRVKECNLVDSMIITNIDLESSPNLKEPEDDKIIRSPRKTIFFDEKENMMVTVHEKVEMRKSEYDQTFCDNITINMNDHEKQQVFHGRKTDHRLLGMDITIDEDDKGKISFKKPPVLPISKPFQFLPKHLVKHNKTQFLSPPIKTPQKQKSDEKNVIDEYMDFITSDTPTKKLCHEMCTSKKRGITPLQTEPFKIPKESSSSKIVDYRKSSDILRDAGLELTSISSKTSFEFDEDRKRRTIFDDDISLEFELPSNTVSMKDSRKTLFEDEMEESIHMMSRKASLSPVFALDHDQDLLTHTATVNGTKNMTLTVKAADVPEVEKRRTTNENDSNFACSFNPGSTLENISNMNVTGMSETTNEINRKAARLLKDPMSEVTQVSDNYSSRYLRDVDLNLTEATKYPTSAIANESMDLDLPTSARPDSRTTNIVRVLSTDNLDISGITYSRNASVSGDLNQNLQPKGRETIYATEDMVINEDFKIPIKLEPVKSNRIRHRHTTYDTDINIENDESHQPSRAKSDNKANRLTIYTESDIDVESPSNSLSKVNDQKCRKFIHFDDFEETDSKKKKSYQRTTILEPRDITPDIEAVKKSDKNPEIFTVSNESSPMYMSVGTNTSHLICKAEDKNENHPRFTIYENSDILLDTENIDSRSEPVDIGNKYDKRLTTFNDLSMNETVNSQEIGVETKHDSQTPVNDGGDIQIETESEVLTHSNFKSNRSTVFNNDNEIEEIEERGHETASNLRRTTFDRDIEIEREVTGIAEAQIEKKGDADKDISLKSSNHLQEENMMEITDMDKTLTEENCSIEIANQLKLFIRESIHEKMILEESQKNDSKHRIITCTNDIEIDREYVTVPTSNAATRFTIHEDNMEIDDTKNKTILELEATIDDSPVLIREAAPTASSISMHDISEASFAKDESTLTNIICLPPAEFDDAPASTVNNTLNGKQNANSMILPPTQLTFVFENDPSIAITEVSVAPATGKKNFANITETEFSSFLENESDPCMQEVSVEISSRRSSMNTTQYRNALQEYVNKTLSQSMINATICNTTITNDSPTVPAVFTSQLLETPVDYGAKFQSLVMKLEKKENKPQKSEIDEFLEKLNIEPVKIPSFHSLEPGFLEREAVKTKEKVATFLNERRERHQREAKVQLPEIPSYNFLIRNRLEW